MQISVEISLYPLTDDYEEIILGFLAQLKHYPHITAETNGMSTRLFGAYDAVMECLQIEMKKIYENHQAVLVMKMARGVLK
jgi:uncharacterized protein YqgV (UPF0045/DUF77 family)